MHDLPSDLRERMTTPRPRVTLFRQLVVPTVGLVLAAVLANVGFAAWLAARRSLTATEAAQDRLLAALESARVPLAPPVLETLERMTGSEFIVWDQAAAGPGLTTLSAGELATVDLTGLAHDQAGHVAIAGRRHRVATARSSGVRPETVFMLTPVKSLAETTLEAIWPVLAVAAATLAVLVPLGLRATGRLAGRIGAVERHVERIGRGEFGSVLTESGAAVAVPDEIGSLVAGINRLSVTLAALRDSLVAGERQRLLGQLAAGFAHELRNAITGARLAIDLHRRRCHAGAAAAGTDESLGVAVRQLDIVEEEVRGLLALGRPPETAATPIDVATLVREVGDLTGPRCEHAGVRLECVCPDGTAVTGRREALRAAVVNLVLNAVDAAGRGGSVRLAAEPHGGRLALVVEDNGPGPPPTLAATLHEPFVTGKPEGVGLGLAVARAVAEQHAGTLEWRRENGRTRFSLLLPTDHGPPVERSP